MKKLAACGLLWLGAMHGAQQTPVPPALHVPVDNAHVPVEVVVEQPTSDALLAVPFLGTVQPGINAAAELPPESRCGRRMTPAHLCCMVTAWVGFCVWVIGYSGFIKSK